MANVRMTTKAQSVPEAPARERMAFRGTVRPVAANGGVEADKYRSMREELDAAEERFPSGAAEGVAVEAKDVVEELNRLGGDAVRVLQPLNEKALRLVEQDHVDEQA
jgi:hypothetical protein